MYEYSILISLFQRIAKNAVTASAWEKLQHDERFDLTPKKEGLLLKR